MRVLGIFIGPGRPRGLSDQTEWEQRRRRLDRIAAEMREFYLNHGKGCKTRAKVIAGRCGGAK